jgi:N-formylglutamate amidohydrolase
MKITPYHIREPSAPELPLVVSIPHCGIYVPEAIAADFASGHIRSLPMTDWYLHHLYDFLPALGVTTIFANYSRFVADLNRPPDDAPLYPGRFETGCVPLKTFWGEDIYRTPPTGEEIATRRELVHAPYHARLLELLQSRITRFGGVVLMDAHSVVSRANLLHGELQDDIYLGDRDGTSNPGWLTDAAERGFRGMGLKVVRNKPYKGGYITEHYGRLPRVAALQIEMCWRLYMDEQHPEQALNHPNFTRFKRLLKDVLTDLVMEARKQLRK